MNDVDTDDDSLLFTRIQLLDEAVGGLRVM